MSRLPLTVLMGCVLVTIVMVSELLAQTQHPPLTPQVQRDPHSFDVRRRLAEVDRLLLLNNLPRAESLLGELEQQGLARHELLPRYIKLAQQQADHAEAARLCREALAIQPNSAHLWRELAVSLLQLQDRAGALEALSRFVNTSPNRRSGLIVAVDLWQKHGYPAEALALCDSARVSLQEPRFLARQRAACLFSLSRPDEGSDELVTELRTNPLNLPLIRKDLVENAEIRDIASRIARRLTQRAEEPQSVPGERILAANLLLLAGDAEGALGLIRALGTTRQVAVTVLQNTATLAREMPLLPDAEQQRATTEYLLTLLAELSAATDLENSLRTRLLDIMAGVCETALAAGTLAEDPEAAVARLEEVLLLVKQGHPLSAHLYSAQIRLAHYRRDVLGEPLAAAASLERLLTDLELPLEGVALARLTLGECYLAAGDTARGRLVLTRLGHSSRYREAAGHAHFHLARLDLAEGHWETARDRFASVALDNPMAAYANDALDLGLAVAEELDNPTGGPSMLQLYGRSVYFDLTAQPDSQRTALNEYVALAERQLDLSQPQHLLERARFELAQLHWSAGQTVLALYQCDRIVLDHPDGRYPAAALALRGEILATGDQDQQARESYERLLMQYPDYLFADDIRDRIRSLP